MPMVISLSFLKTEWRVETNIHYRVDGVKKHTGGKKICRLRFPKNPATNWWKYKCVWTPDYIKIYYNDKLVRNVKDFKIMDHFSTDTLHVIFDVWPADIAKDYGGRIPMPVKQKFMIRNFSYTPLKK
jgi:Glycosyl hydrolases family 16.